MLLAYIRKIFVRYCHFGTYFIRAKKYIVVVPGPRKLGLVPIFPLNVGTFLEVLIGIRFVIM